MFDQIKQRIIESEISPHDLRIVLEILKEFEDKKDTLTHYYTLMRKGGDAICSRFTITRICSIAPETGLR